jgi:hypothetical protein
MRTQVPAPPKVVPGAAADVVLDPAAVVAVVPAEAVVVTTPSVVQAAITANPAPPSSLNADRRLIPLQAQLVDGMILITGSTEVLFADYSVTAPSAPVVVSVEDNGILEFQLWLSR